jgi:hypothetical protein
MTALRSLATAAIGGLVATVSVLAGAGASPAGAATVAANPSSEPTVLINELANGGPGGTEETFFELRNWGDQPVDLSGWNVYRCSFQGLRANYGREEAELQGVVLEPGEIFTVSRIGMPGDDHFSQPLADAGFGLYLEDPERRRVDAVGVYPNEPWPTQSECSLGRNLSNSLNFASGESWQRVAATGVVENDFVKAASTITRDNRLAAAKGANVDVVISEFAGAGPQASDDDFIELLNSGNSAVDLGGWSLFRCTATGRLTESTRQLTIESGTRLGPGERWVAGGPGFAGEADARYATQLADVSFGVLLQTARGELRGVASIRPASSSTG